MTDAEKIQQLENELEKVKSQVRLLWSMRFPKPKHEWVSDDSSESGCCSCGWICGSDNPLECKVLWEKHVLQQTR